MVSMESPAPPSRLIDPSERVLQALADLQGKPEFEEVLSWLRDSQERNTTYLICSPDEQVRELQSACGLLKWLVHYAENASEILRAR